MKIRLLSDLHLEFCVFNLIPLETDKDSILVLAGDIGNKHLSFDFLKQYSNNFKAVFYILGNHEYYGKDFLTYKDQFKQLLRYEKNINKNIFVIDDPEEIFFEDQQFLCGTLWTDFNKNDIASKDQVQSSLNDYYMTKVGNRYLTPDDTYEVHCNTMEFFKERCNKNSIIITHHMPSEQSVADKYKGSDNYHINAGFRSNLDDFILQYKPKYWLYGHGHNSSNFTIGNTRLIANPRGYPRGLDYITGDMKMENPDFNQELVIDY